jgi:hypothetical protein
VAESRYNQIYNEIVDSFKQREVRINKEFERQIDPLAKLSGQKYTKDEALTQLNNALYNITLLYNYSLKPRTPRKKGDPPEEQQIKLTDAQLQVAGWENFP